MEMKDIINGLDQQVPDPTVGLPEELFLLFSRMTPLGQAPRCQNMKSPKPGQRAWFSGCPDNIIEVHKMYREYL